MSQNENMLNVAALQHFINQVKAADIGKQREVRLDIATAKNISYNLALAMTRLAGNYESLLSTQPSSTEVIDIRMDGGGWTS